MVIIEIIVREAKRGRKEANGVASIQNTDGCFFAETMILDGYLLGDEYGWSGSGKIALWRIGETGRGTVLVQASKGAALAKLQRFLDKGELAQKRAVFLEALDEATDGDAHGIVMHAAG